MPKPIQLVPHPAAPPSAVEVVSVQVEREQSLLRLIYIVEADPARLVLPPPQKPYRADHLWETTCFELFVRDSGAAYREFNFSPSSQWAAYRFEAYRDGGEPIALDEPPAIGLSIEPFGILLWASLRIGSRSKARIGLSAVVEEIDAVRSYWALKHPSLDPDFHHPDCFALELPPPQRR